MATGRPDDPFMTCGIQFPTLNANEQAFEGERQDNGIISIDPGDKIALAAEISETEALKPRNLNEAKSRPDWPLWEKAIEDELGQLEVAGTWKLINAPEGANIVGSKWVFCAKKDTNGKVVCYKAHLMAQGFSQVPGVNYFDTFIPVARLSSIWVVLAITAVEDFEIHQIDIKGAYLNGVLTAEEMIYMKQLPGYSIPNSSGKVCCLQKTLYGLKQSGHRWYQRLVEIMVDGLGFKRSDVDQAVFYRHENVLLIIVLVHVDDCTIAANKLSVIQKFKIEIAKYVEITDLGELH